ncbi:hypothetical protein V6R21_16555 [Limibacter armeniacum]|uniref:hypothetical protein n=1 Tax=Limibacter armeniacum TaxID=466084 RepID=UPI002FE6B4EA
MKYFILIITLITLAIGVQAQPSQLAKHNNQLARSLTSSTHDLYYIVSPEYTFEDYKFEVTVFYNGETPVLIVENSSFGEILQQQIKYYLKNKEMILQETISLEKTDEGKTIQQNTRHYYNGGKLVEAYIQDIKKGGVEGGWNAYTPVIPEDPNHIQWLVDAANLEGEFYPVLIGYEEELGKDYMVLQTQSVIPFTFQIPTNIDKQNIGVKDALTLYKKKQLKSSKELMR